MFCSRYLAFCNKCDQIGRFFKVLGEFFVTKVVQLCSDFWVILKNIPFQIKTALATFWKNWATFYFSIWSHCNDNKKFFPITHCQSKFKFPKKPCKISNSIDYLSVISAIFKWFLKGHSLYKSFQSSRQYKVILEFADDWIWTADLWCQKRLLYQLSHNQYPAIVFF